MIIIPDTKFSQAHDAFKALLLERSSEPFLHWRHPFLIENEIAYKYKVFYEARQALDLGSWRRWARKPGKIIQSLRKACKPTISANLLEHRYGNDDSSESPLCRARTETEKAGLEAKLLDFFLGGPTTPIHLGPRFDALADYLRENRLGCKWPFLAYLAFLADSQKYFPILPSRFEHLLAFYDVDEKITRSVSWTRYTVLLDLADALKDRLSVYGDATAIELQSYMWVISSLIEDNKIARAASILPPNFAEELEKRVRRAREMERIGMLGEQFVYDQECDKLRIGQRLDLVRRVTLVSAASSSAGYDLLSFDLSGRELHIEVKTTTRSQIDDIGFWLPETEKQVAQTDDSWVLFRVWDVDSNPSVENLGNIVRNSNADWELNASSWFVRNKKCANGS
jgi:hypothetical protein